MNEIEPYEDHVLVDEDGKGRCFACGNYWPCESTSAYNDGLNDGQVRERDRIVHALHGPGMGLLGAGIADLIAGGEL